MFYMEETATSIQIINTSLSDRIEPGCPGGGAQRQGGSVQGGQGGVEGRAQTASEGDEGRGPLAFQGGGVN